MSSWMQSFFFFFSGVSLQPQLKYLIQSMFWTFCSISLWCEWDCDGAHRLYSCRGTGPHAAVKPMLLTFLGSSLPFAFPFPILSFPLSSLLVFFLFSLCSFSPFHFLYTKNHKVRSLYGHVNKIMG